MEDFIRDLILDAVRPIRELVDSVRARLAAIYSALTNALARVRAAFGRWVDRARAWATAQARHAVATALRLRWFVATEIPRRLGQLAESIRAWTREHVTAVATLIRTALGEVRDWAAQRLRDALNALVQLKDYATLKISEIWRDLTRVRDLVGALLTSPERLARWVAGAMLGALVDIAIRDVDRWADYLMRHRRDLEIRALTLAERILDRIM